MTTLLAGAPVRERAWAIPAWVEGIDRAAAAAGFDPPRLVVAGDKWTDSVTFEVLEAVAGIDRVYVIPTEEPDRADLCACDERQLDPNRHWCLARFEHMAAVRNRLLEAVRSMRPDLWLQVDSDIVLHDLAVADMVDALRLADAAGSKVYLAKAGTREPNFGMLSDNGAGYTRNDETGVFRVGALMAVKLMTPLAYHVDYRAHRHGEDLGWAVACREARVRLAWSGRHASKHVMAPDLLGVVDTRVGW